MEQSRLFLQRSEFRTLLHDITSKNKASFFKQMKVSTQNDNKFMHKLHIKIDTLLAITFLKYAGQYIHYKKGFKIKESHFANILYLWYKYDS